MTPWVQTRRPEPYHEHEEREARLAGRRFSRPLNIIRAEFEFRLTSKLLNFSTLRILSCDTF